jgi:hypothetical protein
MADKFQLAWIGAKLKLCMYTYIVYLSTLSLKYDVFHPGSDSRAGTPAKQHDDPDFRLALLLYRVFPILRLDIRPEFERV